MKIGILTFIHTRNYGANLQCFALQHQLELMGYSVEVLNLYRPVDKGYIGSDDDKKRFEALYRFHSIRDYRKRFNKVIALFLQKIKSRRSDELNIDGFCEFQNRFIRFSSEEYRNFTQLYKDFPQSKYTHLIVGSDQVWNYASDFSKEPFFLTFADNVNKISYAASLGHTSIPAKVACLYKKWLDTFSFISVREDTASKLLAELLGKTVPQVLDPTLLLTKDCWLDALSIKHEYTEKYVLVYMLSVSSAVLNIAKQIAESLDSSVKIITSRPVLGNMDNCELLRSENPKTFVEKYSKACFVITNSFHGTAFAINFNIPFVTVEKKADRLNTRKSSLLKLLELGHRKVFEDDIINPTDYIHCNFSKANQILQNERNKSIRFLMEALK